MKKFMVVLVLVMWSVITLCQGQIMDSDPNPAPIIINGVEYVVDNEFIYEYQFEDVLLKAQECWFEIEETENKIVGRTGIMTTFLIVKQDELEKFTSSEEMGLFPRPQELDAKSFKDWVIIYDPRKVEITLTIKL